MAQLFPEGLEEVQTPLDASHVEGGCVASEAVKPTKGVMQSQEPVLLFRFRSSIPAHLEEFVSEDVHTRAGEHRMLCSPGIAQLLKSCWEKGIKSRK